MTNVFKEIEKNSFIREMLRDSSEVMPPMPQEVLGWNDALQESFCIHSVWNVESGMSQEEADRDAIKTVKKSADFAR